MGSSVRRAIALTVAAVCAGGLLSAARSPGPPGIAPETVAEYIHAVIEADRAVYTKHVVERLHTRGILEASEHWESDNTLPLPAQFLIDAARLVAKKQRGIRYRLISLWPIYERNGPATDFERSGLEAVLKQPDRPHTGLLESGRERFFQAIYADVAATPACIACHNTHPHSPRRDFKLNDVMGGIVITVPVGADSRSR
jgi:hypothetical protein